MQSTTAVASSPPSATLKAGLWVAQTLIALSFGAAGVMKLAMPIAKLAAMLPWTGQVPETFVRALGLIDLLGGAGILLPSLTRIRPRLTLAAAIGCLLLQACAIVFHVARGELANTAPNYVFIALIVFIFWGRRSRAPIAPRS